MRILKNEVDFWNGLATWLNENVPAKKLVELKSLFQLDGGLGEYAEKAVKQLIIDSKKGRVSLRGFTIKDADKLKDLLECAAIDQNLRDELSHLLYGGDERDKYFKPEND